MKDITPYRSIEDPATLYSFYCWAIWNLEPNDWIKFYEPEGEDFREYCRDVFDESPLNCQGFYEWAAEQSDRYAPLQEHLDKFLMISN